MRAKKSQLGFSLIELMIVLLIGMIVMAIAVPNFIAAYRTNRLNSAIIDLSNIVQRARYEAVRQNKSIACRVVAGTPNTFYVDANNDSVRQATEATIVWPVEFQFNIVGTPAAASMGFAVTSTPPLRLTFNGRGAPDYTATAPGMSLVGFPVLLTTMGDVNRPQDGYRALTVTPTGKLTIWRAESGGQWRHSQ